MCCNEDSNGNKGIVSFVIRSISKVRRTRVNSHKISSRNREAQEFFFGRTTLFFRAPSGLNTGVFACCPAMAFDVHVPMQLVRGTLGNIDPLNKVPVEEGQKRVQKGSLLRAPLILPRRFKASGLPCGLLPVVEGSEALAAVALGLFISPSILGP